MRADDRAPEPAEPALDTGLITLREPREAWRANLFWGAVFAGPLLLSAALSDAAWWWERAACAVAGLGALVGFSLMAVQSGLREIRCDTAALTVHQPLFGERIALSEVKSITRRDLRQKLRAFRDIGRPRHKPRQMDTMAQVVVYTLRNRDGRSLLALNRDLEPKREMERLLKRLVQRVGAPIRDE